MNEDNEHFYERPEEEMSADGCRKLVDFYADAGGVKGMLFCVNMQRALYDSDVWERFRDVEGDDRYQKGLRLLSERKIDNFAIWLDRARERGMEAWLTMRMNDSHGLKEAANGISSRHARWPSETWRAHPEWRRAPWRLERSWEGSYNYAVPEVYEHHLALVREIFARWGDRMDGLELDWLRWGFFFKPGFEVEGRALLTKFVKEVRRLADEAGRRSGRRIRLAHRVPTNPESAFNYGFDVAAWKKAGCVDMLTLSLFCGGNDFSLPVGGDADALARGANGVYLFNECYLYSNPPGKGRIDTSRVDAKNVWQIFDDWPRGAACYLVYDVPAELLHPTFNAIELLPPRIPGSLVWASLDLQ